jgi:hypothetical protein
LLSSIRQWGNRDDNPAVSKRIIKTLHLAPNPGPSCAGQTLCFPKFIRLGARTGMFAANARACIRPHGKQVLYSVFLEKLFDRLAEF